VTGAAERKYFLNSHEKAVKDVLKLTNFLMKQNYQAVFKYSSCFRTC